MPYEKNNNFTVDSHYADIDESTIRAYEKICNAVVNGENEVKLNMNMFDDIYKVFGTSFPLFSLVEAIEYLPDSSGIEIKYKNSPEEHLKIVGDFYERTGEIMQECGYGSVNTDRYIFNVYVYITSNFTVDNSVITIPDVLLNNKGYPAVLCSLFDYLVLQGGGKACRVMDVSSSSIISAAQFRGEWYYFNPSLDIKYNQGKALTGFAMEQSRVNQYSYTYTDNTPVDIVTGNSYEKLKSSSSFACENDKVYVDCVNNESFVLEFD